MRFTINSRVLSDAISVASKAAASNSTIPILSGIHIKADLGRVTLTATDCNVSIRHSVEAEVEEPGETVLSAKILAAVTKGLPNDDVKLATNGRSVVITCGRTKSSLYPLDPVNFPDFPNVTPEQEIELGTTQLADIVSKVQRATSKDTQRPVLQGVNLTVANGIIMAVATDSYRLAVADAKVGDGEFGAIVPGAVMKDAMSVMSGETVKVGASGNQVTFESGTTTYISRKVEGNFPNFRQLMPQSFDTVARFDASEMLGVLRRVTSLGSKTNVKLTVHGLMMDVFAKVQDKGEFSDAVVMQFDGPENHITLNADYLLDCISVCDGEVEMRMNSPVEPVVITNHGDVSLTYLLMPVREQ